MALFLTFWSFVICAVLCLSSQLILKIDFAYQTPKLIKSADGLAKLGGDVIGVAEKYIYIATFMQHFNH